MIFGFYFFFLFEREKKWEERESERGRITLILSFQSQLSFNWQANTNQCPKNYSCCITIFEVEKWDIENNSFIVCSPFSLTGSTSSNFYSLKLTFKELDSDIHSWNIKFRNEKELQLLLTPSKDLWRNKFDKNYRSLFFYTFY